VASRRGHTVSLGWPKLYKQALTIPSIPRTGQLLRLLAGSWATPANVYFKYGIDTNWTCTTATLNMIRTILLLAFVCLDPFKNPQDRGSTDGMGFSTTPFLPSFESGADLVL